MFRIAKGRHLTTLSMLSITGSLLLVTSGCADQGYRSAAEFTRAAEAHGYHCVDSVPSDARTISVVSCQDANRNKLEFAQFDSTDATKAGASEGPDETLVADLDRNWIVRGDVANDVKDVASATP